MPENFTPTELTVAQKRLSDWVTEEAHRIEQRLFFGWAPAHDAPNRYKDLCEAFWLSHKEGRPLPVSDENTSSVVFGSPDANMAYRYVHDVGHVEMGLSFSSPDEYDLARWQMRRFERAGFSRDDLEWHLLQADALGQVVYYALTKQYVLDQLQFALDCVRHGLPTGLQLEMERHR
ncbi:hypothetical protein SCMU_22820 [Sinomonas cyclohexanicum]|uniref:Uncharacterized protein n=1 Tax=Sinomonas cyclohexanicum TaxID=322009 RepID=A0ABM7PVZ1_SINCY|nr:hypothetical protein SCMU_22820 [Corynebacterium cyclohexanicum]